MKGWRSGGAGCQVPLSTLLPAGDRKLASEFLFPQISLSVFPLSHPHALVFFLSVSSVLLHADAFHFILTNFICKNIVLVTYKCIVVIFIGTLWF